MGFNPGGGGTSSISGSSDAAVNVLVNDEVLTYDGAVGKWKNQQAPTQYAYYDSGTLSWPSRPLALTVVWVGGDEAHPPVSPIVGKDIWIRDAVLL